MDAEIAEALARRDRFRFRMWARQTWEQRLNALDEHQARAAAILRMSASGYAHFLRRNYRTRATDWVEPATGKSDA